MAGGDWIVCRNIPGQRVGARAWFDHISQFLKDSLGFQSCVLNPCLLRNEKMMVLVHVDGMMVMGEGQYMREVFIPMLKNKFELSCHLLEKDGDELSFLKRAYKLLEDGISIMPGKYIQNMLEIFESAHGLVKRSKVPCDASIQTADSSEPLGAEDSALYRSLVGMAIYLGQERYDICFCVKELASKMSLPTVVAMARLRKLLGYLKETSTYSLKLGFSGGDHVRNFGGEDELVLVTYSDANWSGHHEHRRSTSAGVHVLNGCFLYGSSRTQKVVALSSAESELHALVSSVADGIYTCRCLEFLVDFPIKHVALIDNAAACSLANKRCVGKIRHLSGKLLWV